MTQQQQQSKLKNDKKNKFQIQKTLNDKQNTSKKWQTTQIGKRKGEINYWYIYI